MTDDDKKEVAKEILELLNNLVPKQRRRIRERSIRAFAWQDGVIDCCDAIMERYEI